MFAVALGALGTLLLSAALWVFGGAALAAWRMRSIPSPKAPSLVTGHLPAILSDRAPIILAEWAAALGPLVRLRLLGTPMVLLADPSEAGKVLRRGPSYIPKARQLYAALEVGVHPQTPNMLTLDDGATWKAVRTAVAPAFSGASLKQVFPFTVDATRRTASRITAAGPGGEVDVADMAKKVTSDVMGSLLFGEDLQGVDGKPSEYMDIFNEVLEAVHQRFTNPLRPIMALWDSQARAEARVLREHDRQLGIKVAAIRKCPPPEYTITGHLLNVVDPATGQKLNDNQLKAEIGVVFGAGFETTSHAISWTLAALAAYPDCQERLARELAAAGLAPTPEHPVPRDFEWSDMARLPYLGAVVKETLRLFSPASLGTTRLTDRPVELCGHVVPVGVMVMVSPYAIANQARLYGDDVTQYRPERWLARSEGGAEYLQGEAMAGNGGCGEQQQPQQQQGVVPDAIPFSVGPRDCVGRALADLELQVVVSMLVGRFRWEGDATDADDLKRRACYHVTLQPRGGSMMLRATPREAVAA